MQYIMDNCENAIPAAALAALQAGLEGLDSSKEQPTRPHWRELHCTLLWRLAP